MFEDFAGHKPEVLNQIYKVYLALFELDFLVQRKCSIMTSVLGGDEWSWRVEGITVEAITELQKTDYKYEKGKYCRAHIVGRLDSAKQVYERDEPVLLKEFFQVYWKNDRTVIALKEQNSNTVKLPLVIPIDYTLKNFPCGAVVGWKHRKQEALFLKELHAQYLRGEIGLINPYET